MKNLFYLLVSFLFPQLLFGANFYWVGGKGAWSDFATHWATSSGGTVFHVTIPNPTDDVYFDSSSFTVSGDTVFLDTTITNCRSMDWSAITKAPVLSGPNSNLQVYGSLILSSNLTWNVYSLYLMSKVQGNVINTAGATVNSITISDTGSWDVQHELNAWSLTVQAGTFRTNGYPVTLSGGISIQGNILPITALMDTSYVKASGWSVVNNAGMLLDADSARIHVTGNFSGGAKWVYNDVYCGTFYASSPYRTDSCHFHDVFCSNGSVSGTRNIFHDVQASSASGSYNTFNDVSKCISVTGTGNSFHNVTMTATSSNAEGGTGNGFNKLIMPAASCSFSGNGNVTDTLIFNNPGQQISLYNGTTIIVNGLLLIQANGGFPTSIKCSGGTATISKPTDTVCTDFIYVQNIKATGGAQFFAGDHSYDLGGNSGWNWTRCAPLISNVWPGDVNYDLIVDNLDLLYVGVSYGDTGYVRPGASFTYVAQPCQDWYYQFINGKNVKHADCNGNGIVDANDTTAISLNYGQSHPPRLMPPVVPLSGTELLLSLPPVIVAGSTVSVPIMLGTSGNQANNVYGIAFTLNYNYALIKPGTMKVDYTGSWIESAGNHLNIEKYFPGKLDMAFTRINHTDVSGYGKIGILTFTVADSIKGTFYLTFNKVKALSHNELDVPVQATTDSVYIDFDISTGNIEDNITSTVYPNPVTNSATIYFSNPNHENFYLSITDIAGRLVIPVIPISSGEAKLNVENLSRGIYFYSLKNVIGIRKSKGKIVIE